MASAFKEIFVTETGGIARNREFVRVGVPCAIEEIPETVGFQLLNSADEAQPVQSTILKKWHDGSVKWLLLDFAATVSAYDCAVYRLAKQDSAAPTVASSVHTTKGSDHWRVSTGAAEFVVDAKQFRPFKSIIINNKELLAAKDSNCLLALVGGNSTPVVDTIATETEGPLRVILRVAGRFGHAHPTSPRFACRIHFFAACSHVLLEFTLLNPRAANHSGGLWDLGDSSSLLFKELALQFPLAGSGGNKIVCSPEASLASLQFEPSPEGMKIYQESSGGENWNSPVHRTRDGNVPLRFAGYEIYNKGNKVCSGKRATPVVWYGTGDFGVSAVMPYFWQEFPKAFAIDTDGLKVELFPACSPDLHELQGGEQKTTSIYLDFATSPEGLVWARSPLVAAPSPETCRQSAVFFDLPPITGESTTQDLVDNFISLEDLQKKREIIDEYGWRNFGDIYADHEAFFYKENKLFISHYNNQYDIAAGFYRKFLATGNPIWGGLAADLVRHVLDIDIYHTCLDREEYNQGYFWHTDHYVDAGLSTHRSFSKEQLGLKDSRFCGGGPGAEHCYTTGLTYHYFQTGNPAFKDAVTELADWVQRSLGGPSTVLAVLNKALRYIKLLRSAGKGIRPIFPKYPLTRGTGNAITACLDAYEVSGEKRFLADAEELIRGALHPDDDIAARNLHDPESTWFYTVLIAAVAKFLNKKRELVQLDSGYAYACACLLAYAEWMLKHEYPYLEKPEILEYPNETWAAQDLRKSVIFYCAALYSSPNKSQMFIERAQYFYDVASIELARHKTSSFTRPLALILQNGWIGSELSKTIALDLKGVAVSGKGSYGQPTPFLSFTSVVSRLFIEFLMAIRETSIKKELAWFRLRLKF